MPPLGRAVGKKSFHGKVVILKGNENVKLGIFDGKGMARGNVKVVVAHKKSAPLFHFDPMKHRIHYLFDPPLRVGTTYSHSYPWALPMAIHS